MRFQMKEKLISFGDDFQVKDENGKDVYFIDGRAFAFGKQLAFKDMSGKELAFISQKLFKFKPTFVITQNRRELARVSKALMSFRDNFFIDVPGPDDINVTGRFIEHEYRFERNGEKIATVSKRILAVTDSYAIDIVYPEDTILLLASAVVIDMCCHEEKK